MIRSGGGTHVAKPVTAADIRDLTKGEREALAKLIRQRERLAKTKATERSASLMADFEQQADRIYSYNEDKVWAEAVATCKAAVTDAQEKIANRCRELGIPAPFAPTVGFGWAQQRAAIGAERAKMRHVAKRRVEQIEAAARSAIETASVRAQEALLVGGLTTEAARMFADSIPTAEEMMPNLDIKDLQKAMIEERPINRGFGSLAYDDGD